MSDVALGMVRIGTALTALSKSDAKKAMEEFTEKFRKDICNPALVAGIVGCTRVMSVQEWHASFQEYFSMTLESGTLKFI